MSRVISRDKFFEMIGYKPHSKQILFHNSKARFKVPVCGRRMGKSVMAAREAEPMLMLPGKRTWIVGSTYDLGEKEFRVIWDDMIVKLKLGRERQVKKSYNRRAGEMFIEFPWGSRVEVRSADRPETLVGDGLDYVIMSEASKHSKETWERFIRPALADRRGKATFPTTPQGMDWVHDLWQLGRNPLFEDYDSWKFPSWENEYVYPGGKDDPEILLLQKTMPYEYFQQEICADFTSFLGKIYGEWDEMVHVKEWTYNPALPNYIAFDWGFVNPMAAVEFQVDSFDRVHVWRLHYKAGIRLTDFLIELKNRDQPPGYKIDLCFGDAADPEAVMSVCEEFAPCIADPKSKSNWREGIDLVKSFLRTEQIGLLDEFGTPLYEPWLTVAPSCGDLIREFNNYRVDAPARGKMRNAREDAQKYDDHALDALRYGIMHIFKLGATASLSDFISAGSVSEGPVTGYFTMTGGQFA